MHKLYVVAFICLTSVCSLVNASPIFDGNKKIILTGSDGSFLEIGQINFKSESGNVTYSIEFQEDVFSEEFLSMRPFKCLHKSEQMLCNLIYPYKKKGFINENDLVDLEYDLLFLHKSAAEYGINPWNGLYYDLVITEEGLKGILKEVDLNILVAPPENEDIRPITDDMLYEADPANHLFPELTIK